MGVEVFQTPSGPLKSGIPELVLMPAPVKKTTLSLLCNNSSSFKDIL
jgi:hypothetical protein